MSQPRIALITSLILLACAGCAVRGARLGRVQMGMTRPEVLTVLGAPDAAGRQSNVEYLTYFVASTGGAPAETYMVRLIDSRVESFGRYFLLREGPDGPGAGKKVLGLGALLPYALQTDLVARLQQLETLRDAGALTDAECERAKQRVLEKER